MRDGHVYIVRALQLGWLKIGWAKDIARRMVDVATAAGSDLTLLGSFPGTQADETSLHRRFADNRIAYDWYIAADEMVAFALALPASIQISFVGSRRRSHRHLLGRLSGSTGARRGPHVRIAAQLLRS